MNQNWQGGACEEQHITVNIYFWYHDIYIYIYTPGGELLPTATLLLETKASCPQANCHCTWCGQQGHLRKMCTSAPKQDGCRWMDAERMVSWMHFCGCDFCQDGCHAIQVFFSIPSLEVLQTIDVELFKKHVQLLTDLRGKDLTPLKKLSTTSVL